MAASLVRRFVVSQPTSLCKRVLGSSKAFYSSSGDGERNRYNPDTLTTPREQAIDKFSKLVDKVKKQTEESESRARKVVEQEQLAKKLLESQSQIDSVEVKRDYLEIPADEGDTGETFATMLRKSKLVSLGEYDGRLLQGKIIEVMEDDLYIDFGGKFHCVCPRPKRNGQ